MRVAPWPDGSLYKQVEIGNATVLFFHRPSLINVFLHSSNFELVLKFHSAKYADQKALGGWVSHRCFPNLC